MSVDPIIGEDTKELSAGPGSVVVVKGKRGYRAFLDGKGPTFGERLFGGFERYYIVDVGQKDVSDTFEAPSNKGALPFRLTVKYAVGVKKAHAGEVVQEGLRDLSKIFADDLKKLLRTKARSCDVQNINGARDALEDALSSFRPEDERFSFKAGIVDVSLDDEIAKKVREIESAPINIARNEAVATVADKEITRHQGLLQNEDTLLAAYQSSGDPKYLDALKLKLAERDKSRAERLALLHKMLEKNYIEEMDIPKDLIKDLVSSFTANLNLPASQSAPALTDSSSPKPGNEAKIVDAEIVEDKKPLEG
ncbi:MAG TPA: hypothetical protein VHZ78_06060 [Rhizomicrobium sp.]|jgi:hypothetical protein|nr:hypothetical protein [Rhizomicrobium sp.]